MPSKTFYDRQKIRLPDLRAVRTEMAQAYRACIRRELAWEDFRAATLGLSRIADLDQGQLLEQRIEALEERLSEPNAKPNGAGYATRV